jgi:hypothetical protein
MAERYDYPFVKKVMIVSIAMWTAGCAYMYWTMPHTSRGIVPFFLILYAIPLAIMLGLLSISRWYYIKDPTPPPRRRGKKAPPQVKKK